ncbi:MAG: DoxX family protein, partial [Planctomycetota bacterium]|nr:DoxX family protein [Planctomycetota bacterium]
MRKRDSAALAIAPLFLRLVLAATFIWAGLGKFMNTFDVQGEKAAILANYGVIPNPHAPARTAPPAPADSDAADDPTPPAEESPAPDAEAEQNPGDGPQALLEGNTVWVSWQTEDQPRILATEADFPDPVEVRGYAGLVLLLHSAIHPGLDPEDSSPRMRLWPDFDPDTDYDPWPRYAALAAGLTELIAGLLIGIGLLTRLSAFSIANVMLVAVWLTVIGPAIQSGNTHLGFLPDHDIFDTNAWSKLLWQLSLLGTALALLFAGPGALSMDRLLLGGAKKPPPK